MELISQHVLMVEVAFQAWKMGLLLSVYKLNNYSISVLLGRVLGESSTPVMFVPFVKHLSVGLPGGSIQLPT